MNNNRHDKLRVSTKEIDETIYRLQIAFSEGRLDEDDFRARMDKALVAKTNGELDALCHDLPARPEIIEKTSLSHVKKLDTKTKVFLSGIEQKGHFLLPKHYEISAILAGMVLDLSDAEFESQESHIHVSTIMGGITIFVPKGVQVTVVGAPLLGGIFQQVNSGALSNDARHLYIHAKAILGGIEIKTKE